MGNVHFNITDASDNEEYFKIYRSDDGGAAVIDSAKEVATLSWNGTAWTIANGPLATDAQIEPGSDSNNPSNVSQVFKFSYTESNPGVYNYGVVASNFVGDSPMRTTNNAVNIGSSFPNVNSLLLDGVDEYASTPSDKTITNANKSVTGWFKLSSLNTPNTVWGHPNGYQTSFALWDASSGTVFFRTSAGNNSISSGSSFGSNWFHLAITGDGTDLKMYYNGSLAATASGADGDWFIRDFFKTGTTGIQAPTYWYGGYVDELAIWDGTTLSAPNVAAIANAGGTAGSRAVDLSSYSGISHWWRFGDGDSGATISDKVGSYDLTLVNSPVLTTDTP